MPGLASQVTGHGDPAIVFVHGFACDHTDWDGPVAWFASRNRTTIAVDLPGHGNSPAELADCSMEGFGTGVAELLRARAREPVILVGHSMGCRVVTETALQVPDRVAGLVLVDGSQFAPAMEAVLSAAFGRPDGYPALIQALFGDMFTGESDKATVAAVMARARRLSRPLGEKLLTDLQRYDVHRFASALAGLRPAVMAIQTTTRNEVGRQTPLRAGQTTPYLTMLRAAVPAVRIEVLPDTGHFPHLDKPRQTIALLDDFLAMVPAPQPRPARQADRRT